jgi:polyhydroxyalkanoate synthesis regulator phasin
MPQNDMLKRYLDAGVAFTQMTRSRAESIVKDLVKAGELQQKQAQKQVDDLVERSRKNTEQLMDLIRKEITAQLASVGIATKEDIARLEAKINAGGGAPAPEIVVATPAAAAAEAAAAAPGPAPSRAKKAPAKKSPAKKATAKKAASAAKAGPQ